MEKICFAALTRVMIEIIICPEKDMISSLQSRVPDFYSFLAEPGNIIE